MDAKSSSKSCSAAHSQAGWLSRVIDLYADGFRSMRVGRKLWVLILIKLAILFGILKVFFFPDLLQRDYDSDSERAEAVRSHLIQDN